MKVRDKKKNKAYCSNLFERYWKKNFKSAENPGKLWKAEQNSLIVQWNSSVKNIEGVAILANFLQITITN